MAKEISIFAAALITICLLSDFAFAQEYNNELKLEILNSESWQSINSGEEKIADLNVSNNTNHILDGEMKVYVEYQGVCSDGNKEPIDGSLEIIYPYFQINNTEWLIPDSDWQNGEVKFLDFEIPEGETLAYFKINTHPALCPGDYTFNLELEGTAETGEEYATTPITLGSGGGGLPLGLTIKYENSQVATTTATITWLTSYKSTSRVIYDTVPDKFDLRAGEPKYGYAFATAEFDTPANLNGVTGHSITIYNLSSGTAYYFRCISHASPEIIGTEHSFTTLAMGDTSAEGDAGDSEDTGAGDAGDGDIHADSHSEGASPTVQATEESPGTGEDDQSGVGVKKEFEYGDHIWEHQDDDDQLSVINDLSADNDQSADEADNSNDSKFLAGIGTFFSGLEGWRLALVLLLGIILALIILRLIRTWIDRKK